MRQEIVQDDLVHDTRYLWRGIQVCFPLNLLAVPRIVLRAVNATETVSIVIWRIDDAVRRTGD
jgi:hypothetical protein